MATLSKKFGLSKRHAVLLKVASIFADTGYYININDYSKYSYDIVKSNPIIGLSQKGTRSNIGCGAVPKRYF